MRADLTILDLVGWRKAALAFLIVALGTLLAVRASIFLADVAYRLYERLRRWRRA